MEENNWLCEFDLTSSNIGSGSRSSGPVVHIGMKLFEKLSASPPYANWRCFISGHRLCGMVLVSSTESMFLRLWGREEPPGSPATAKKLRAAKHSGILVAECLLLQIEVMDFEFNLELQK